MHLFLKNNIKIKSLLVWLILDPIKLVKYGVFIFKGMPTLPYIYLIILHGTKVVKNEMTCHFSVSHHVSVHLNTLVCMMIPTHRSTLSQLKNLEQFLLLLFLPIINEVIFNNFVINTHWDHLSCQKYGWIGIWHDMSPLSNLQLNLSIFLSQATSCPCLICNRKWTSVVIS
jgi:hypothetical protein